MAIGFNKSFNVQRLVKRMIYTLLALFVGGLSLQAFVTSMYGTESPFYNGLSFIGVSVGAYPLYDGENYASNCLGTINSTDTVAIGSNCINSTTISRSVLSVVGIIAISVILLTEFLSW